jgi:hypothetical protein
VSADPRRVRVAGARIAPVLGVALAIGLAASAARSARPVSPAVGPISLHSVVRPSWAGVGEKVHYEGRAVFPSGRANARWVPPMPGGDLTWGPLHARRGLGAGSVTRALADTLVVEADLQAFRPGLVSVPGIQLQGSDPARAGLWQLPVARLTVMPMIPGTDTAPDLRPVRGPLGAPWWERVPWAWVAAGAIAVALALIVGRRMRRRRPVVPVAARAPRDPAAEALARLAELRALDLPGRGRFGDHALALTSILRRFLEATERTPRPGDTTTSVVHRLETALIDPQDTRLLVDLLRGWDRVKFGRAETTAEDARRSERAVESFVKRRAAPPVAKAA